MSFTENPKLRSSLQRNEPDKEIDVASGGYLFFTAQDNTEIKVEMREDGLYIWNLGKSANFSLSVIPVSSNVVKINPAR